MLFNDTMFPLTSSIGFLEVDCQTVAKEYASWMQSLVGMLGPYKQWKVKGDLKSVLLQLQPLRSDRVVFVPTQSNWTALFGNSSQEFDVSSKIRVLSRRLKCRSIRATAAPHTYRANRKGGARGRYGGVTFELIDPAKLPPGSPIRCYRGISAANDGGRWTFDLLNTQLPFEEPEYYTAKRVKDRFPPELLERYLKAMGIRIFEPDFYMPVGQQAIMFQIYEEGLPPAETLQEAQMNLEGKVYFTG
jgi:hypothetical protein